MQWEYPHVLWGLLMLPCLLYLFVALWRQKQAFWQAWCQLPFTRQQSVLPSPRRYLLQTGLFLLGFTLSVFGFASPILSRTAWEPVWENVALVVLIDVSRSMEARRDPQEANAPSRFEETKEGLLAFLAVLPPGVKLSLVPFADSAVPITSGFSDDHDEMRARVRRLHRDFFYKQGTNLTTTLREGFYLADAFARQQLGAAASSPALVVSLVLISDGDEPLSDTLRAILVEHGERVPVFTIGVGSARPAYIPDALSPVGYLVDRHGNPVTTALNEETLRFIAEQTGGAYYPFAQRGELFAALQEIIRTQGSRSQRAYPLPYPLRPFCFFGAFLALLIFGKLEPS
jgi:Ca-activated chloride channel family protein